MKSNCISHERKIQLSEMNPRGYLLTLCILLFDFQIVFCNEFAKRKYPLSRPSLKELAGGLTTADEQTPPIPPQFECGHRALKVVLKHADVVNLQIHGPLGDLLHLGQLAAFCGVSIKTSLADIHLLFRYDSCYVKREGTEYVLSLSWYGRVHVLSCPASVTPPSIVCKNNSMEMTIVDGTADELSVALNGEWAPLLHVATECWNREWSKQGELTFSVPYTSCSVNFRDGHFILDLKSKGKMMPLSCPYVPIPVFPVKDPGLSETTQPLPEKPPTVFPNQIVKQEQAFPVEQQEKVDGSPPQRWLPKLPSLPGSFNLAVNFPFSLPIPTQPVPLRDPLTSKYVAQTPAPTPAPVSSPTQMAPSVQNQQPLYEQMDPVLADLVTKAPKSHYMYPYRFQKPASSHQSEPSLDPKYQFPVASTSLPFGSAQNYNFPRPNPLQGNPSLANLAQYLPPGYFICSYNQQQNPRYQKMDTTQPAPAIPAVPPMNRYSQQQPTSAVASIPHDSGTQFLQPTQHIQPSQQHPYFYQRGYGHQGSTTTPLSPYSPLIPINLQPQTSRYPSYPALQDARPFHPEYYQKPSGSVQQPWSTSHLYVTGLSQESKPLVQDSSHTPEYLKYQTGGDQSLYQRPVVHTSGREISSHSQYQPSQLSTFPRQPLRPEALSVDVSTENTRFGPKEFFQPRSIAPVPSPPVPKFTGNNPIMTLPQPMPRFFPVKEGARVAQLPYRQGPSVRAMQNPHVHSERPSEPSSQNPQNDTLPLYQFYRRKV